MEKTVKIFQIKEFVLKLVFRSLVKEEIDLKKYRIDKIENVKKVIWKSINKGESTRVVKITLSKRNVLKENEQQSSPNDQQSSNDLVTVISFKQIPSKEPQSEDLTEQNDQTIDELFEELIEQTIEKSKELSTTSSLSINQQNEIDESYLATLINENIPSYSSLSINKVKISPVKEVKVEEPINEKSNHNKLIIHPSEAI